MNIRKISIGLLFLILALIVVPGALAHPMKAAPTSNTGVTACEGCHDGNGGGGGFVCNDCHVYPTFSLTVKAAPTSVQALSSSDITLTVGKINTVREAGYSGLTSVFSPANGASLSLSGPGVSASGTSNSAGIGTIPVNPTGSGTITATAAMAGFNSGTAKVTVTASAPVLVLKTITVTPLTANVLVNGTQTFVAAPKDQNGNAIKATVTWTSSNTTVGTINANGKFTAVAAGTTTIKAASGTVSGTAAVTVTVSSPLLVLKTITVTPLTANVLVNGTQTFVAAPKDQNGNAIKATVTWTSSNTTVGTIDANGKFTAVAAGTTTIKAASGTVSGTAAVTVTVSSPLLVLKTITVTPLTSNVLVNGTQTFVAAPKDQNGNAIKATVTWTSSNSTVGTIDATGKFTAVAAGTTTIKAASGTVSGTAGVTVTASSPSYKYYIVTFVLTDKVTGKPIYNAKISMDGVRKETNRYGTAVFNKVSLGNHNYQIKTEKYKKIEGTINVSKNMKVSIKLIPVVKVNKNENYTENKNQDKNEDHD